MISLRVATLVIDSEADGPGRRCAVWCAAEGGTSWRVEQLGARVLATKGIEGITLLGEPIDQALAAAALARQVRAAGLTVMVFSGYRLEELAARREAAELFCATDLLVDGRYRAELPEPPGGRRFVGSRNQNMYFLTDRYAPDDPRLVAGYETGAALDLRQRIV